MKLYGCPNSRSLRATWALEEAGAEYEYIFVDLFKGEGRQGAFLAVNPSGRLPVLVDGDLTLTESAAIVTYVGEKFPHSGLVPAEPRTRADYLRWCAYVITEVEQPLWTIARHRFILPAERRVPQVEDTARWDFGRESALLANHLENREFLLGERFSGADILLGHTFAWARSARVPLGSAVLERYQERLFARPAAGRARKREKDARDPAPSQRHVPAIN